jgi:hypothetical protein
MSLSKNITQIGVKVAFIDNDGKKVGGITVDQANQISQNNPDTKFYFQNGDGLEEELSIDQVNQLTTTNLLPTAPACSTGPQVCGPPLVRFFGGGGYGASANSIISPISSSIIGFDIVNSGFGFLENVSAELIDPCGKGSGSRLRVNLQEDDEDTAGEDAITGSGAANANTNASAAATAASAAADAADAAATTASDAVTAANTANTNATAAAAASAASSAAAAAASAAASAAAAAAAAAANAAARTAAANAAAAASAASASSSEATAAAEAGNITTANTAAAAAASAARTAAAAARTAANAAAAAGASTVSISDECSAPRKNFENRVRRNLNKSKKIKNITIIAPGNGYIASPDGSLGGNERVWKEPDEGYAKSKCGGFYVIQPYKPISVKRGDTYYPPNGSPIIIEEDQIITLPLVPVTPPIPEIIGPSYPVILVIDEVVVLDPGFGYRPGDEIIITSTDTGDTGGAGGGTGTVGGAGGDTGDTGGAGGAGGGNGDGKSNLGAELEMIINDKGQIEKVNVIKPGAGFIDLPRLRTNSPTGFNAIFSTILKPIRLEDFEGSPPQNAQIISVIDCVGKISPNPQFDIIPR